MDLEFGDADTEQVFVEGTNKKFNSIAKVALRKLRMMEAAATVNDLRVPPGNRLEKLVGNLDGYHSIRINDQWRIVFKVAPGKLTDIRIEDYH